MSKKDRELPIGLMAAKLLAAISPHHRESICTSFLFKQYCHDNDIDLDEVGEDWEDRTVWLEGQKHDFATWMYNRILTEFAGGASIPKEAYEEFEKKMDDIQRDGDSMEDMLAKFLGAKDKAGRKSAIAGKPTPKLSFEERARLSLDKYREHIEDFMHAPIQYGEPTKEDFDYIIDITSDYAVLDCGLSTDENPGEGPWLITPGQYEDFNDLASHYDIQIGDEPQEGFEVVKILWMPTSDYKEPYQAQWHQAMEDAGWVIRWGSEEALRYFEENHAGKYVAVTAGSPLGMQFTLYVKE